MPPRPPYRHPSNLIAWILAFTFAGAALAAVPILHDEPFHGSPVRGYSDDIVFITGSGFVAGAEVQVGLPGDDPATLSNPATIVLESDDSITVRLPSGTTTLDTTDPTRALWVRNGGGETAWAGPVLLNDPRPLWTSPSHLSSTDTATGLPRELTIVGRGLHLLTDIKLEGPSGLYAINVSQQSCSTASYSDSELSNELVSVVVPVPSVLAQGTYTTSVKRACGAWVPVEDNLVEVEPSPTIPPIYPVAAYGCVTGGGDDTNCVLAAIADAKVAGGVVYFGPGVWDLDTKHDDLCSPTACPDMTANDGILVREGVDLIGASTGDTTIRIGENRQWDSAAAFTLLGTNRVARLKFLDRTVEQAIEEEFGTWPLTENRHLPQRDGPGEPDLGDGKVFHINFNPRTVLRLGLRPEDTATESPVDNVTIVDNEFLSPVIAILDGGFALSRITIAYNSIQAFRDGIRFTSTQDSVMDEDTALFNVSDSVIEGNVFDDSPYSGLKIQNMPPDESLGVIAFQIGASERLRVTNNTVVGCEDDGTPGCEAVEGFRAGFFFSMHGNHEMLLVDNNDFIQVGRKSGDGEAVVIDENKNRALLEKAARVDSATASTITTESPTLIKDLNGYLDDAFRDHWVQITSGTGIGQTRKLTSIEVSGSGNATYLVASVTPPLETIPDSTSLITIHRQAWHAYFTNNDIDATEDGATDCDPGLSLDSPVDIQTGALVMYSTTSDSLILGNTVTCGEGIWLSTANDPGDPDSQRSIYNTAIIGNWLDRDPKDAFEWDSSFTNECTGGNGNPPKPKYGQIPGGIRVTANSADSVPTDSPTLIYGVSVARNELLDTATTVNSCGSTFTGAISVEVLQSDDLIEEPELIRNTMIWGNEVDLSGSHRTDPMDSSVDTFDYLRTVLIERGCDSNRQLRITNSVVCNDDSLTTVPAGDKRPSVYNEGVDAVDCDGNPDLDYCWCASCSGGNACDTSDDLCVECLNDLDCTGNANGEHCDTGDNTCGCVDNADCDSGDVCDATTDTCVECVNNLDCTNNPNGEVCDTSNNTCVECVDDLDCTNNPNEDVCDTSDNTCVECVDNDDCDAGDVCRVSQNVCVFGCANDAECGPGGVCVKDFGEPLGFCL